MRNKTTKTLILFIMLIFFIPSDIHAQQIINSEEAAIQTIENYFKLCQSQNDDRFKNHEITDLSPIYDANNNELGFSASLFSEESKGYAIVLKIGNNYILTEISPERSNPYSLGDKDDVNIYAGPFNYYKLSSKNGRTVYDITTKKTIDRANISSINDFIKNYKINNFEKGPLRQTPKTVFLKNYSAKFEKGTQNSSYKCVPTSFAMALKYLHNTNQIKLSSSMLSISTMRDKLFSLMNGTTKGCFTPSIGTGLKAFSSAYCNIPVVCHNGQWWPNVAFSTVTAEIDGNFPLVAVFSGTPFNYTNNHACPVVGYHSFYGQNYTIVIDPMNANQVDILWNETNVAGLFVLYVGN